MLVPMLGPLNGLRLRFANMMPGLGGGAWLNAAPPSLAPAVRVEMLLMFGAPARTRRMFDGKVEDVGVAGSTLMLLCGDLCFVLAPLRVDTLGEPTEMEDVLDALLCVWWWCGIERMLDTELLVDLRPRRPPEDRR